jgi:TatD DNase family protein
MIDSHCHLDAPEFAEDVDQVVQAAHTAGVTGIVVPAVQVSDIAKLQALTHRHRLLSYALGVHPMFVDQITPEHWAIQLRELRSTIEGSLNDPQFIGIGEIGLDGFVAGANEAWQRQVFEDQLRLARDFELPVIMHVRKAVDPVLARLRRFGVKAGIAHAFNGSEQQARACIDQGLVLGFGGAMTFTRALQIRRLAQALPLESIVLETDSPDISPAWLAPARNSPDQVVRIAGILAQLRGLSVAQVGTRTSANVRRVLPRLGLSPPGEST